MGLVICSHGTSLDVAPKRQRREQMLTRRRVQVSYFDNNAVDANLFVLLLGYYFRSPKAAKIARQPKPLGCPASHSDDC